MGELDPQTRVVSLANPSLESTVIPRSAATITGGSTLSLCGAGDLWFSRILKKSLPARASQPKARRSRSPAPLLMIRCAFSIAAGRGQYLLESRSTANYSRLLIHAQTQTTTIFLNKHIYIRSRHSQIDAWCCTQAGIAANSRPADTPTAEARDMFPFCGMAADLP